MCLTISVLDTFESSFTQQVIKVDQLWVARISHTMVAHENDIDDFRQVPSDQCRIQVFRKSVHISQCILNSRNNEKDKRLNAATRTHVDQF